MNYFKLFVASLFSIAVSCAPSEQQLKQLKEDSIHRADSVFTADSIKKSETPLPDTSWASVDSLDVEVYLYDSITDGHLKSFNYLYQNKKGCYTFRGNELRNADFEGKLDSVPSKVSVVWTFSTGYDTTHTKYGTWGGGTGWTGEPVYVQWSDESYNYQKNNALGLKPDFGKTEIMVGSLCQKIYFIDYQTGKMSREPMDAGNPIKGSISLNPTLNGDLYVGMGIPARGQMGHQGFNIFTQQRFFYQGNDNDAWRGWHAFDSSPLVLDQFLFWPGENGIIYKYIVGEHSLKLHSKMKYRLKGKSSPGMESSMSVYKNYGYIGDNHGNLLCINLNTLKPVWRYFGGDDTDSSPVIEVIDGVPFIYSGTEVDKQEGDVSARFAKLNGLTGEFIWRKIIKCKRLVAGEEKTLDGGYYCTPLLGKGDCDNLIFANVCTNLVPPGIFVAFDKKTGEQVYSINLYNFAWPSPTGYYTPDHKMYILNFDASGNVYLIEGKTGKIIYKQLIGCTFESSPAVIGNCAVVGSRGSSIYKFKIE